jgi:hypothetical protein
MARFFQTIAVVMKKCWALQTSFSTNANFSLAVGIVSAGTKHSCCDDTVVFNAPVK